MEAELEYRESDVSPGKTSQTRQICRIYMQHDNILIKLNFDNLIPSLGSVVGGGIGGDLWANICYHVAAFVIFDMQHDHVLKKLNFDPITPPPGSGVLLRAKYSLPCCCICDSV